MKAMMAYDLLSTPGLVIDDALRLCEMSGRPVLVAPLPQAP